MYSKRLYSITITMIVIVSLIDRPVSEAISVFKIAKIGTMSAIGAAAAKGALVGKAALLGGPIIATKILAAKLVGTAAVVGGLAGAKAGVLVSKAKTPLFLAGSSIPNLISLAPLLKNKNKGKQQGLPVATPTIPPPPPQLDAPKSYAPQAAPSYTPQLRSQYSPPVMAPRSSYSQPSFSSGGY